MDESGTIPALRRDPPYGGAAQDAFGDEMIEATHPERHPFVRKIASIATFELSDPERTALEMLPMEIAEVAPHQDIACEHDRPGRSFAVLRGIAASYKITRDGDRQITAYYVPGDVPDFQSLHLEVLDFSIAAASPCRIGFVGHDALRALFDAHPRLGSAVWRATLIDGAVSREWLLNIGRREAYPRLAHLFCELVTRMRAVGRADGHSCEFPVRQADLADALGITQVHLGRVLRELRERGLITFGAGRLTVHDWPALTEAAGFDPTYLHLPHMAA